MRQGHGLLIPSSRLSLASSCGLFSSFFSECFYNFFFPAHLVRDFTLSGVLDKPWSQVRRPFFPRYAHSFLSRIGFSTPITRRFASDFTDPLSQFGDGIRLRKYHVLCCRARDKDRVGHRSGGKQTCGHGSRGPWTREAWP